MSEWLASGPAMDSAMGRKRVPYPGASRNAQHNLQIASEDLLRKPAMTQRTWHEVNEGDRLPDVHFPLTVTRLVMAAGANRDFYPIHHNAEFARETGATDMYANIFFLQGMWERSVREFIGPAGHLRSITGFSMKAFNTPGQTLTVEGRVLRKWLEADAGLVEIELLSRSASGVSVGPGRVLVELPLQNRARL